jgi:hypothetical protein
MAHYTTVSYDRALDVVHIRYHAVVVADDAGVAAFAEEIDRAMRDVPKPVDIIIDLGELIIKPAAARAYDLERQRMLTAYAKRAFRYGGSNLVRTKILTSSTLHGQAANVFANYEEALEALRAARAGGR